MIQTTWTLSCRHRWVRRELKRCGWFGEGSQWRTIRNLTIHSWRYHDQLKITSLIYPSHHRIWDYYARSRQILWILVVLSSSFYLHWSIGFLHSAPPHSFAHCICRIPNFLIFLWLIKNPWNQSNWYDNSSFSSWDPSWGLWLWDGKVIPLYSYS